MNIQIANLIDPQASMVLLAHNPNNLSTEFLSDQELQKIIDHFQKYELRQFLFHRPDSHIIVKILKEKGNDYQNLESFRRAGDEVQKIANELKVKKLAIKGYRIRSEEIIAFTEGCVLGNYQFLKYITEKEKKSNSLTTIELLDDAIDSGELQKLQIITDTVYQVRDLVNEPVIHLNADQLAHRISLMADQAGVKSEIFNKKKIESLKMGGLLAVNKGSPDPPTFTVLEYCPADAINQSPVILAGKGVVYDTGGMNIKTGNYMDTMKCDMAGAAVVAGVIHAAARIKLPLHLVGLIPATDNRVDANALTPGDIITMHNGTTVEVLNTDAEGRLILADALSYARKYNPQLVITVATLTGSAMRAIGKYGIVAMEAGASQFMEKLKQSGWRTYERVAEFPFWDEYAELLQSDIADMKNVGPPEAGAITAGKFLEKFTSYPFIHMDIAGVAFFDKKFHYHPAGGTGFGVRLLIDFLQNYSN